MKHIIACTLLLALLLAGCGPDQQEEESGENPSLSEILSPDNIAREFATDKPIYRVETPHAFSDPQGYDQFQLILQGSTITGGEVTFTLRRGNGEEVHRQTFAASELLDPGFHETYPEATVRMQEAYIIERMRKFFVEENFTQPAVRPQDTFDPARSDRNIWEEIKADPTAISFYYLIGKGPAREMVWSKKQGKVVGLKE